MVHWILRNNKKTMDNIIFRGKCIQDGKWVYGYLHKCVGRSPLVMVTNEGDVKYEILDIDRAWILESQLPHEMRWDINNTFIYHDVFPSNVGRYTGMPDKNGVRIFENDIVSVDDFTNVYSSPYIGKVVMRKGQWCVEYHSQYRICRPLFFDDFANKKTEVIGNIYDTPELLGGGEK